VKYSVLYQLGLALPYVHFMFLIWVVFEIFTPILGRSGTEIPPDVVLATLVTLATLFLSSFFVSRVEPWLILASFPKEGRGQERVPDCSCCGNIIPLETFGSASIAIFITLQYKPGQQQLPSPSWNGGY
jgi:hypothetical protein